MSNEHTPKTFRKKPVEIQAVQWDGTAEGATPIIDWILGQGGSATCHCAHDIGGRCPGGASMHTIGIRTLEGTMQARHGDWIIRGVQGEFYPCKPDIFAETYDSISSPVVPAPTETGPWQDWPSLDAIPADVRTVWDKAGDEYRRENGGWKFRSPGGKWQEITLPLDDYIDFAPFTTAAVAVWDPELGTRNDWTLNEGAEK